MLKNTNKYQTLLAVCLLTLSACSTNETLTDSPIDQSKTPIELTAGIIGENAATTRGLTRTVTNDNPYGHAAAAFSSGTSLYMVLKSEYGVTGASQSPLYSRSMGSVTGSTAAYNEVTFGDGYKRYWEDSYSRDSKLSVYSACVPGNTSTALNIASSTTYNNNTWSTTAITPTIVWPLEGSSASQNADFLNAQDLCFSNNVSGDNHIYFATSAKKFTPKEMFFHHALTKVTFKIKKGNGFESASFAFTSPGGENIVLKGFNSSGTLDISTGEFGSIGTTDITYLADTKTSDDATEGYIYVLTGLMLPGSVLTSTATNEVYFTIDNNKYHITKAQLATALADKKVGKNTSKEAPALATGSTMRPGVHYIFTMTVSKSQISNLSAAVVGWEEVTASTTPSNARISVSLLENGTAETSESPKFDLFRSANVNDEINDNWASYDWAAGYGKAYLQKSGSAYAAYEENNHSTPWYWPNNKTFYHFRTLKPQTTDMWKVLTDNTDSSNPFDYVTLEGAAANSYRDVCWGASFNNTTGKLTYDPTTYGFDGSASHQISKAIGPTTSTIKMNTFHMMSDVTIKLTTTDGTDAVTLSEATVKLTPVYNTGTVRMGNGLINTTGSTGDITGTVSDVDGQSYKQWRYGFVPQSLEDVVLTITTTDHNQYIVNMKDMVANTVSDNIIANPYTATSSKINRWYPNFSYTYTFHLTKTGIEKVTATLAAWGAVTADPQTVVIQ